MEKSLIAAMSVSIGAISIGFTAGWSSPALQIFQDSADFNLTSQQKSWVSSLMPLSALVGSVLGGRLLDSLGRKKLICWSAIPSILGYLTLYLSNTIWMLYVGRLFAGLSVGFLSLSIPMYLSETAPQDRRGALSLLPTFFGNGGVLLSFILGYYLNWTLLNSVGVIIPTLLFVTINFLPESPRWLASKGRKDEARKSLLWIRGTTLNVEVELEDIISNITLSKRHEASIKTPFMRKYRMPFSVTLLLMTFQQLSGINAVIYYSSSIFKSAVPNIDSSICNIIMGFVNLLSTLLASLAIDRIGRKPLLYISSIFIILSLLALSVMFHLKEMGNYHYLGLLPLCSIFLYIVGFSLGWGPIPWLLMSEILPVKIRAQAGSIATAWHWVLTFLITNIFLTSIEVLGEAFLFAIIGVTMIFGWIFTIFFVSDTKGMSLEDIETKIIGRDDINLLLSKKPIQII